MDQAEEKKIVSTAQDYDKEIEVLRGCVDRLMDIGADRPDATEQDIKDVVADRIGEIRAEE